MRMTNGEVAFGSRGGKPVAAKAEQDHTEAGREIRLNQGEKQLDRRNEKGAAERRAAKPSTIASSRLLMTAGGSGRIEDCARPFATTGLKDSLGAKLRASR